MRNRAITVLIATMCALTAAPAWSDDDQSASGPRSSNIEDNLSPPPVSDFSFAKSKTGKPMLVLVLSGGGCKAVAEIGVLRSLEKHHVPIDAVVGTSMGATIGALYCAGMPLDRIQQLFVDGELANAIKVNIPIRTALHPLVKLAHIGNQPYGGFSAGKRFTSLLRQSLPATFSGLRKPFVAVATNLTDGRAQALGRGDLPQAILASNCAPPVFRPVEINGKVFADGGLRANMPARMARKMGADLVVAVLVDKAITSEPNNKFKKIQGVVSRVTDILLASADSHQVHNTDILIYPNADDIPAVTKHRELLLKGIAAGEAAADKMMPEIMQGLIARSHKEAPAAAASAGETE